MAQAPAAGPMESGGSRPIPTGFQVIHGNRLENLRELAVEVIRRFPLAPLEEEVFLVHSNGIAQWLKLALARDRDDPELAGLGIAAAMTFSLPSRFLWQVYRAVLGSDAVATESPFDKDRMTWRLLRMLPAVTEQEGFAPLARFLSGEEPERRLFQLAEKIADLFDQYQVYRADWLEAWSEGRDVLLVRGQEAAVPAGQSWQPALWRLLLEDIGAADGEISRADVHNRFLDAARSLTPQSRPAGVPARLVVFGVSSLPQQTLEVLSRLGQCSQVLLCVHNPCRFYWADIVEDRELLRAANRRGALREGMPAVLDDRNLHLHAHPLLAAWGKQGRDYIRLLDEYDNAADYRHWFERIDLFDDVVAGDSSATLLARLQDDILNLRPVSESRSLPAPEEGADGSLVFHTAHSPQREVEILHDQLLAAFNSDPALKPQDIIVMVPDINAYAPHIQAVFGRFDHDDRRFIPFTISDQGQRHQIPVLVALEHLLALPESRIAVSDVLDLLDVASVRERFGLTEEDLPLLHQWISGANIRWGLQGDQKRALELPAEMEQNTWMFGLHRMLLGYATGEGEAWQGIEPYDEVGGLESQIAGRLDAFIRELAYLWQALSLPRTPGQWLATLNDLRDRFFGALDDEGALIMGRLEQVASRWLATCEDAGLADVPLPLTIVREEWLAKLDQGGLSQRFLAGKVNFATLMPMRAIPFSHICLLGMNDGDYPRSYPPMDFDLMAGDYRPGDRSRREDDRYLFLEALLSARKRLYISWIGRSVNDNSERPPSVLVAQLRDHLDEIRPAKPTGKDARHATGPATPLSERLTTEHPLQPFSPRYFSGDEGPLFTYAGEWRSAHDGQRERESGRQALGDLPEDLPGDTISLSMPAGFLKQPVEAFFRQRLGIYFDREAAGTEDDEPFVVDGLGNWKLTDELISQVLLQPPENGRSADEASLEARLTRVTERQAARGELPAGGVGVLQQRRLTRDLPELYERYQALLARYPVKQDLQLVSAGFQLAGQQLVLEDWLDGLRATPEGDLALVSLHTSGLTTASNQYKWPRFLAPWVNHLAACLTLDGPVNSFLLSKAGDVSFPPLPKQQARDHLHDILTTWLEGLCEPLPVAPKTAFAWLDALPKGEDRAREAARTVFESAYQRSGEVDETPALQRAWPDFDRLVADGRFTTLVNRLYRPLHEAVKGHSEDREAK